MVDGHFFSLTMNTRKVLPCGALAFGVLIFLAGVVFVAMYISEAILARVGDPDQSLLFWYSSLSELPESSWAWSQEFLVWLA